jgi:hypothetical protein
MLTKNNIHINSCGLFAKGKIMETINLVEHKKLLSEELRKALKEEKEVRINQGVKFSDEEAEASLSRFTAFMQTEVAKKLLQIS